MKSRQAPLSQQIDLQILNNSDNHMKSPLLGDDSNKLDPSLRSVTYANGKVTSEPALKLAKMKNTICNQKYNVFTFVPRVLYDQFKYFFNMFYLVIAISQFIPVLSVGLLFSYVAPLVLVLLLTMVKEGYEDYQRFVKDKEANGAMYNTLGEGGALFSKQASKLRVGDVIELVPNERVPADILLIYSSDETGSIFVKTDQLDGETDWKLRRPITDLNKIITEHGCGTFLNTDFTISYEHPQINIYKFQGAYNSQGIEQGLNVEHTAWAGVKLACGRALGLVIYIGRDMKMSMNIKQPTTKFGKLDQQLNFLSKLLFVMMVIISFVLLMLKGFEGSNFKEQSILLFRYLLLLSSIIPISMRVNLDFAKLMYSRSINNDPDIPNTTVRNSNIPEELGRVEYILSDKTGTLTKNEMHFKKLVIDESNQFGEEEVEMLKKLLAEECGREGLNPSIVDNYNDVSDRRTSKKPSQKMWKDLISALILCHNVTPAVENGERLLQGSSPDEVALVKLAEGLGYKLIRRTQFEMSISNAAGYEQNYDILAIFPFSSQRKRMGIIVYCRETKRHMFYLKGADVIMKSKLLESKANFMVEACTDLASQGLRTLVICQKAISEADYNSWKISYDKAKALLVNRESKENQVIEQLEKGLEFIGITGVQDKLQDNIRETISSLRGAGINFWMLTGDKIETAICIAVSTQIKSKEQKLFIMQDLDGSISFQRRLGDLYEELNTTDSYLKYHPQESFNNILIVIDGVSLKMALGEFSEQFFRLASRMPSLVCSRCSPTQKEQITDQLRQFSGKRILGIGDGGNDVGMIQAADVGIGIYGKEGIQAALASDFSITEFKNLNTLLLWHGRLSYKRSCVLSQFIIHRGIIISFMQAIFCAIFFFVAIPIFNGMLMLGYSTVFTLLPVFSLVLDEDISKEVAYKYPILYRKVQSGSELNWYTFLYWIFISLYQAAIIMILIIVFFKYSSFYLVTTISFTCLIFIEFLNVFFSIHRLHIIQIAATVASVLIYVLSMVLMRSVLNINELITTQALLLTLVIVLISWLPPFLYKVIVRYINPTDEQRVMKQANPLLLQFSIQ